jgi:hypothetical protein
VLRLLGLLGRQSSLFGRVDAIIVTAGVSKLLHTYVDSFELVGAVVAFAMREAQAQEPAPAQAQAQGLGKRGGAAQLCVVVCGPSVWCMPLLENGDLWDRSADSDQSASILDLDCGSGLLHIIVSRLMSEPNTPAPAVAPAPAPRLNATACQIRDPACRVNASPADRALYMFLWDVRVVWSVLWKLRRADLLPRLVAHLRDDIPHRGSIWRYPAIEVR